MPRVSTLNRPAPSVEQGATPRPRGGSPIDTFQPGGGRGGPPTGYGPNGSVLIDEFRRMLERKLEQGSFKVPRVAARRVSIPRRLLRLIPMSPLGRAVAIGWQLGEFAYEIYEERTLWGQKPRMRFRREVPPTVIDPNPYDMTGWTEKLAWQSSLTPVNNPPNFIYGVTGDIMWGDFWTTSPAVDPIPGTDQKALPYQEPFGGTWWRSFSDPALETAGEFTTTQWISNTDGVLAPTPENDGWYRGSWTRNVGTVGAPIRIGGFQHQDFEVELNPNIRRFLKTEYQIGYGTVIDVPPEPVEPWQAFKTVVMEQLKDDQIKKLDGPKHKTEPPRRHVRENKTLSRSAKIAVAVFHALDTISEWSELVDAIYDALPKDVKDRWSKGRKKRGMIDAAGQYGIDGADWKLQALWYNWHKVDGPQAFKNIVANEYQDKVLGLIHKNTPVNTGQATSGAMKEVNKEIEAFLKTLGF